MFKLRRHCPSIFSVMMAGRSLMTTPKYKKMAGISAGFLSADFTDESPVGSEGMIWNAEEIHLKQLPRNRQQKPAIATVLAFEGLEEYDIPLKGDFRTVVSIDVELNYFDLGRGLVQLL